MNCPVCKRPRPSHEDGCEFHKLVKLSMEMWYYIYKLEGRPTHWPRCGQFESRLLEFVEYPGSSCFPSTSSPSMGPTR